MDRLDLIKTAGVAAVALSLAGCNLLPGAATTEQSSGEMTQEAEELARAMESGKPLSCLMTDPDGGTINYYMKDGKTRVEGMQLGDSTTTGYMINDGVNMYTWSEGAAEGMKIAVPTEEEMAETEAQAEEYMEQVPDFEDETEVANWEDQGYTIDCENNGVTDDMFIPPTTVSFVDFGAMMQQQVQEAQEGMSEEDKQMLQDAMNEANL
jgi:hypothetical protein